MKTASVALGTIVASLAAFAACSQMSEDHVTDDAPLIENARSIVRRPDGRFDVSCDDGSTQIVTANDLRADAPGAPRVCPGGAQVDAGPGDALVDSGLDSGYRPFASPGLYVTAHDSTLTDRCDYDVVPQFVQQKLVALSLHAKNYGCDRRIVAKCVTAADGRPTCVWTTSSGEARTIRDIGPFSFTQDEGGGKSFTYATSSAPEANAGGAAAVLSSGEYTSGTACKIQVSAFHRPEGGLSHIIGNRTDCDSEGSEVYSCEGMTCKGAAGTRLRTITVLTPRDFDKQVNADPARRYARR